MIKQELLAYETSMSEALQPEKDDLTLLCPKNTYTIEV